MQSRPERAGSYSAGSPEAPPPCRGTLVSATCTLCSIVPVGCPCSPQQASFRTLEGAEEAWQLHPKTTWSLLWPQLSCSSAQIPATPKLGVSGNLNITVTWGGPGPQSPQPRGSQEVQTGRAVTMNQTHLPKPFFYAPSETWATASVVQAPSFPLSC